MGWLFSYKSARSVAIYQKDQDTGYTILSQLIDKGVGLFLLSNGRLRPVT